METDKPMLALESVVEFFDKRDREMGDNDTRRQKIAIIK
jgi:hypothetical protein